MSVAIKAEVGATVGTKPTLHTGKSANLQTHAQLSYKQNGNTMSARKRTMLARVGKKSRATRENRILRLNATHARITDLAPKHFHSSSSHVI